MSVAKQATIIIRFTDYWLSGTGASGEGDLDLVAFRDAQGCPAMPMTQIKGQLRETAERLWQPDAVIDLFGGEGRDQGKIRFSGTAGLPKDLRTWFAFKNNRAARACLFQTLRSTAIAELGVARTDTLRTAEVAVSMTISGVVEWVGEESHGDDWVHKLDTLCRLTFAFGHGKNDGLGRALARCEANGDAARAPIAAEDRDDCRQWMAVDLTPRDSAVFSRRNANLGEHISLNAPPGSALWGWAISQLKDDPAAIQALLSGKIRFSDAVPLVDGTPAFPAPKNLFCKKGVKDIADKGLLDGRKITVGMAAFDRRFNAPAGIYVQAKAVAPGYVTGDLGRTVRPATSHRLRSAHQDGMAKKASLFGYQGVDPDGLTYRTEISADGVNPEIWEKIRGIFQNVVILGKARNSGYGGAFHCTAGQKWPSTLAASGDIVRIRCLSDVVLLDRFGALKAEPEGADFGLGGWKLNRGECAVTTRRFAPWDRTLNHSEAEIAVIEAGSIFAFERPSPNAAVPEIVTHVGLLYHRGFGRVALMPDEIPEPPLDGLTAESSAEEPPEPTDPLIRWTRVQANLRDTKERDEWLEAARADISGPWNWVVRNGPSRTQWSRIAAPSMESGLDEAKGWGYQVNGKSLSKWLQEQKAGLAEKVPAAHQQWALEQLVKCAQASAPSIDKAGR